ncbi:hypothetical protein O3Q51_07905 [Cryomorphaceae bacterium 1068]|nr:hypothetical protein [Cryomorphaceae bacterium 1068]
MSRLLKYALILVVVVILSMAAAFFLAKKFEPEVKDAIVYELNQHLNVPVDVEDINLSLLQKFPYASLRFSQVVIPEAVSNDPDTLIYIEDLYLQIGLLDFLSKNYKVSEAEINRGFFNMQIFADGSDNFHFWKSSSDTTEQTFSLTNVEVEDFEYVLKTGSRLALDIHVTSGEANGNFGEDIFNLKSDVDFIARSIVYEDDTLYKETTIDGQVALNIDTKAKVYTFESEKIRLGEEKTTLNGAYDNSAENAFWTVQINSENTELENAVALIPLPNQSVFKTYQPSGNADLDLSIATKNGFELTLNFDGLAGEIIHSESSGRADVYSGRGTLELAQGKTNVTIKGLEAGIGPGRFSTSGEIANLNAPDFDLALQGRIELEDLKEFLNISFAEVLEGRIDVKGQLKGNFDRTDLSTERLLRGLNFLGAIVLEDGAFKTEGRSQVFEKIEGSFEIVENSIRTKQLTAEVGDNKFEIKGQINNALPYLTGNGGSLEVVADLKSKRIYLEQLLGESEGDDNSTAFRLPAKVGFKLNIEVDQLDYKEFTATALSGKAYYRNGLFTLNPARMTLASGTLTGSLRLNQVETGFELGSNTTLSQMNVDELFANFDDFGQKVISHDQIEGLFNGAVNLTCSLDTTLAIRKESVKADVNLKIENGELKEVESLIDIADYIKGNTLWNTFIKVDALKERLRNVEFETLENNLTIENQIITIPEMKIATSVLDISASGTHDFDNNIDYSIGFRLSELLRTGREKDSEFGYVVDDDTGLRIFMRMAGTIKNPEFSSDKETAREKRKEKFEEETKTFKGILKEEFGLFKSDTTLNAPPEKSDETKPIQFDVEFGEPSSTDTLKSKKKKRLSKKDQDLYDDLEDDDDL